jgi:protein dpy-30
VVPLLLQGMSELVKVRPEKPVEWIATYLLKNNTEKK